MKQRIILLNSLILCSIAITAYAEQTIPPDVLEARAATMQFQQTLKKELMSAMQSGGPNAAVEVCHRRAPEIAEQVGKETGWRIGRTSLKTRNEKNAPNTAEREILELFEQREHNGDPIASMEWWEQGEQGFAYMKAIPMKGICATCHGSNISPSLKEHIVQFYPHDMATGFEVGDIRGAFTLKKYLSKMKDTTAPESMN